MLFACRRRFEVHCDLECCLAEHGARIKRHVPVFCIREVRETQFFILLPVPVGRHRRQAAEPFLTGFECQFGSPARGNVKQRRDNSRPATGKADSMLVLDDPACLTAGINERLFFNERRARYQNLVVFPLVSAGAPRIENVGIGFAQKVV